jgi:predicted transcriptional regulator YdeE
MPIIKVVFLIYLDCADLKVRIMEPKLVKISTFPVKGLKVRTTNRAEQNPSTAAIGALWGRFYASGASQIPEASGQTPHIFGVYCNYESDLNGAFDVIAAVSAPSADITTFEVAAGEYLVFRV